MTLQSLLRLKQHAWRCWCCRLDMRCCCCCFLRPSIWNSGKVLTLFEGLWKNGKVICLFQGWKCVKNEQFNWDLCRFVMFDVSCRWILGGQVCRNSVRYLREIRKRKKNWLEIATASVCVHCISDPTFPARRHNFSALFTLL